MKQFMNITYCCKTCGTKICRDTALYGNGECRRCSKSGEKYRACNFNPVCVDCGKPISRSTINKGGCRCKSCSRLGERNWNRDPQRILKCIICGNRISSWSFDYGKKRCNKCYDRSGINSPLYGRRGKRSPAYKYGKSDVQTLIRKSINGRRWIKACLTRDNFTCQDCGNKKNLIVHHINSFAKIFQVFIQEFGNLDKEILVYLSQDYLPFWKLENGITLCKACHKIRHKSVEEIWTLVN